MHIGVFHMSSMVIAIRRQSPAPHVASGQLLSLGQLVGLWEAEAAAGES